MVERDREIVYRPERDGVAKVLGDLGGRIMEVIWKLESATVRQVHAVLAESGADLAYTTVKTVMTRIYERGYLRREAEGKGFRYWPTDSREDFIARWTRDVFTGLMEDMSDPVMSAFVDELSPEEAETLAELARRIEERRKGR